MSSGMQAIGRFGIGFFSVFMLGDIVRVISRRCDKGDESAAVSWKSGEDWPVIRFCGQQNPVKPLDGGTRVRFALRTSPVPRKAFCRALQKTHILVSAGCGCVGT